MVMLGVLVFSCKKGQNGDDIYFPEDGLVSYFRFEDNLKDELGNTPDGVNSNNSPFISGVEGKAISFNGVDQKVVFDRQTYKDGSNFSISFWFKKSDNTGLSYAMECNDFIFATNQDEAILNIDLLSMPNENARGSFTYGEWTHFVGTYDGLEIKAYINGELKETKSHSGTIDNTGRDLALAFRFSNSTYWEGAFDELFIYERVLSLDEVIDMYNR